MVHKKSWIIVLLKDPDIFTFYTTFSTNIKPSSFEFDSRILETVWFDEPPRRAKLEMFPDNSASQENGLMVEDPQTLSPEPQSRYLFRM